MDLRAAVRGFSTDTARYHAWHVSPPPGLVLGGALAGNAVYGADTGLRARVEIQFNGGSGHRIFLGAGLQGHVRLLLRGSGALVYIGNDCILPDLDLRSWQDDDVIVVGNGVTTAGPNRWISGGQAPAARPMLVVGDDCMFASDIVLRNTDGHPVYDLASGAASNLPQASLFIEPHVWVGDRAAVLKDVTVGACSVIGFGAVVTRDVPRFAVAHGVPARCKLRPGQVWSRATGAGYRRQAEDWAAQFSAAAVPA